MNNGHRNQFNNSHRNQMIYTKTEFNHSNICMLSNIFKCCKCKRNNNIIVESNLLSQLCLFCGTPNYVKREKV